MLDSFARMRAEADLVLVEGAGSAAEINLRQRRHRQYGLRARRECSRSSLIGDIDRGGVIAQIVGTKAVIDPEDAAMIGGFLVNKFRGDATLFDEGMRIIARTHRLARSRPAARSSPTPRACRPRMPLRSSDAPAATGAGVTIAVPMLSRIANFDDFDPLRLEPERAARDGAAGRAASADAELVILPGSKATIADLAFLRAQGWDIDIIAHRRRGGRVLGLCGGYQMLGDDARRSRGHRRVRRARSPGSACSMSRPCCRARRP